MLNEKLSLNPKVDLKNFKEDPEVSLIHHLFNLPEGKRLLDVWQKRYRNKQILPISQTPPHGTFDAYIGFCEGQKWMVNHIEEQLNAYKHRKPLKGEKNDN